MTKTTCLAGAAVCAAAILTVGNRASGEQPPAARAAAPQMAVFRWATAPASIDAFAKWIAYPDVWAEEFDDFSSWDNIEGQVWLLDPWSNWVKTRPGRRLILGVPLLVGPWDGSGPTAGTLGLHVPVSLKDGAAGKYNEHYRALAQHLVEHGLGDSILRLGWEFNGGWYTWRAGADPKSFAQYWREIVAAMRAVPGADHLAFDWNPALGFQQFAAEQAWPGDKYVDYVGVDVYDDSWARDTYPIPPSASEADAAARRQKAWEQVIYNGDHGLKFWSAFAAEHHKPLTLPEWGVSDREDKHGGLDDPAFVKKMHEFIVDPNNHVAFHCYFDVQAPDGHHQLSPGAKGDEPLEFPKSTAVFKKLFGPVERE